MRLHSDYMTHMSGEEQVIVATGASAKRFCGIAKGNATTAFIVDCLKEDTTKEAIIQALATKYQVSEEVVADDVDMVLCKLEQIGALVDDSTL